MEDDENLEVLNDNFILAENILHSSLEVGMSLECIEIPFSNEAEVD